MAAGSLARRLLDSLRSRHASDVENDGLAGASVLVLHASVRCLGVRVIPRARPTDALWSPCAQRTRCCSRSLVTWPWSYCRDASGAWFRRGAGRVGRETRQTNGHCQESIQPHATLALLSLLHLCACRLRMYTEAAAHSAPGGCGSRVAVKQAFDSSAHSRSSTATLRVWWTSSATPSGGSV